MTNSGGLDLRRPVIASIAVIAVMLVISVVAWIRLPADATVPIHWDLNGIPNGYAPKAVALLISPVIGVVLGALFWAIPRIEPRRANLARGGGAFGFLWIAVMVLLLGVHLVTTLAILDTGLDIGRIGLVLVGLLLVVVGLVLPRFGSNFLVGIRTPWTLTSERAWKETHRLGAWLFVALGVGLAGVGLLRLGTTSLVTLLIVGAAGLAGLIAYSYVVWRSDPDRETLTR